MRFILLILLLFLLGCKAQKEKKVQEVIFYKDGKYSTFNDISFRLYKGFWYMKFNKESSSIILNEYKSIDSLKVKTKDTVFSVECEPLFGGVKHKSLLLTPVNDNNLKIIVFEKVDKKGRILLKIFARYNGIIKPDNFMRTLVTEEEYEEMKVTSWED